MRLVTGTSFWGAEKTIAKTQASNIVSFTNGCGHDSTCIPTLIPPDKIMTPQTIWRKGG